MYPLLPLDELLANPPELTLLNHVFRSMDCFQLSPPSATNPSQHPVLTIYQKKPGHYTPFYERYSHNGSPATVAHLPHPTHKNRKSFHLHELLDTLLTTVSPAEQAQAAAQTRQNTQNMLRIFPPNSPGAVPRYALWHTLFLHTILEYARKNSIQYTPLVNALLQTRTFPTPAHLKPHITTPNTSATLLVTWRRNLYAPELAYHIHAEGQPAFTASLLNIPATVRVETTPSATPTIGTLCLAYNPNCLLQYSAIEHETIAWLANNLNGTPIPLSPSLTSPLSVHYPT